MRRDPVILAERFNWWMTLPPTTQKNMHNARRLMAYSAPLIVVIVLKKPPRWDARTDTVTISRIRIKLATIMKGILIFVM
jgi:hypothetical protein